MSCWVVQGWNQTHESTWVFLLNELPCARAVAMTAIWSKVNVPKSTQAGATLQSRRHLIVSSTTTKPKVFRKGGPPTPTPRKKNIHETYEADRSHGDPDFKPESIFPSPLETSSSQEIKKDFSIPTYSNVPRRSVCCCRSPLP